MLAGGITPGMEDTGHAVSCFRSESYLPVHSVKGHSEVNQVSDAVRGFVG